MVHGDRLHTDLGASGYLKPQGYVDLTIEPAHAHCAVQVVIDVSVRSWQ